MEGLDAFVYKLIVGGLAACFERSGHLALSH
jgi:hypothetical protein